MAKNGGDEPPEAGASPSAPANAGHTSAPVFLSYASADKSTADTLCAALESAGIPCWIAPRDVTPGVFYADAIVEAINASKILIVVISTNSTGSQHVLREVERASSKRKPVIAFRLDATPLPTGLEYFLSASHWLDASGNPIARAIPALVDSVRRLLGATSPPVASRTDAVGSAVPTAKSTRKVWWTATAVALMALLSLGLWLSQKTRRATAPVASAPPAISDKSIAVLPFMDMSEKHDQEYFAAGMAEEVSDLLAKLPSLRVIGRSSVSQLKTSEGLREIGRELGAAYLVQGSVRRAGDKLRVTARLMRTDDNTQIWADNYDAEAGDVLKLQDRITMNVVRALQLSMGADEAHTTQNLKSPEAYNLYLRGRHEIDTFEDEDLQRAVDYFQHSLDLDPTFVRALEWLAIAQESQAEVGAVPPVDGFERAKRTIERGLQLKSDSAPLISLRALISAIYDWDWNAAANDARRALALEPHSAVVLENVGIAYLGIGPLDEAIRLLNAALSIDPLDPASHYYLGEARYAAGRLPEAEAEFRKFMNLDPKSGGAHFHLGLIRMDQGDLNQALIEMQSAGISQARGTALVYHAMGRLAESRASLAKAILDHATDDAFGIAQSYAYLGDAEATFMWLDRAYEQKDVLLYQVKFHPLFDKVKSDPRFKAFLRKMNLPE